MIIVKPEPPPGSGEEGEVPESLGSSVLAKAKPIRGRKGKYITSFPEGNKGQEIENYLKGGSKEGVEVDDIYEAARKNREKGFNMDTSKGLNFTVICTDRYRNEYQIVLRRAGGIYAA